jgi:uncharacterized protein (DUF983 family)
MSQSNTCPHCQSNPCLPWLRKAFLGPTGAARCRVCGFRVGAKTEQAFHALLPSLLAFFLILGVVFVQVFVALPVVWLMLPLLLGVVCLTVTMLLNACWVSLMRDEATLPFMIERVLARKAASRK